MTNVQISQFTEVERWFANPGTLTSITFAFVLQADRGKFEACD